MKIEYLIDHKHFIPELGELLFHQFGYLRPGCALKDFEERLGNHCNRDGLPITYIALEEGKLVGTFSLRKNDMDTHQHLSPWLGGVFVHPSRRKEGIGTLLVKKAESLCAKQGFKTLFLFTPDQRDWYSKFGWRVVEETIFNGSFVTIMSTALINNADNASV